ncbi:hypothetical protein [Candidatus Nitrososphaera evergladensis]|uniref:hypothetical protein n=1 Tax=Candidatus Nitrososphaera evergladensis TaxID=1459637 RepID=UPI0011E598F7|nr:hypothetical protein [Candidatus Nitrososphaera evergladensis]
MTGGAIGNDDVVSAIEGNGKKAAPSITIDPLPANNNNSSGEPIASNSTTTAIIINGKASGFGNSTIKMVEVRIENATYEPATPASPGDWSTWTYHYYYYPYLLQPGIHEIVARATDSDGSRQWYVMPITVSQAQDPSQSVQAASPLPVPAAATTDRFGITKLYPTAAGGLEWSSSWDNDNPRQIGNEIDPDDSWFDTDHGEGTYTVDGNGTLTAAGNFTRMYVHDPANVREWSENLEITVYVNRINETQLVDYSGPEIFARTNHGTNADENVNLCDDRGYGGVVLDSGKWAFVKEIAHHLPNGYTEVGTVNPWSELPKNTWVGIKFVLRNMDNDTKVKLELYRDMTGGLNGGRWEKMTEFIDNGTNFGVGMEPCKSLVNPALPLVHSLVDASSESKKPMLSVYIRSEFATVGFSNFSIREINPLP